MPDYEIEVHYYDVVVVGAGGAGLRATLGTVSCNKMPAGSRPLTSLICELVALRVNLHQVCAPAQVSIR